MARFEQPRGIDNGLIKEVNAIGPELVIGVAGQVRHQRHHHRRWSRAIGVAGLAQDAHYRVLTQGTGGPAIRLGSCQPPMGLLMMDLEPVKRRSTHSHPIRPHSWQLIPEAIHSLQIHWRALGHPGQQGQAVAMVRSSIAVA